MSDNGSADDLAEVAAAAMATATERLRGHITSWLCNGGSETLADSAIDVVGAVSRFNMCDLEGAADAISTAYARSRVKLDEFMREAERNRPGPTQAQYDDRAKALARLECVDKCCTAIEIISRWDRRFSQDDVDETDLAWGRQEVLDALATLPTASRGGSFFLPDGMSQVGGEHEEETPCGSQVRDLIDDGGALVAVYGAPNSGKTFLGVCIGGCVSEGIPFDGRATRQSLVVYWAAEGGARFADRIRAWQKHHGGGGRNLLLLTGDFDLTTTGGVDALLKRLSGARLARAMPVGMLFIDTVARALSGADENSASSMGAFLKSVARIQATGITVVLVHHSGKKVSEGLRGHSSLAAACDTIIEVTAVKAGNVARVVKQRDMACEGEIRFRIVPLGQSAVVDFTPPIAAVAATPITASNERAGLLAADVAAAAAGGKPMRANGAGSVYQRRGELSPPLRGLGRDPLAAMIRSALDSGLIRKEGGELFRLN